MKNLEEIGSIILGWAIFITAIILIIFLIKGGLSILPILIKILNIVGLIAFVLCLTLFPILAFIKKTRTIAVVGFMISSYIFGISTWLLGFGVTLTFWGWIGVIIGIFILGVGVVPFGIIASLLNGEWFLFISIIISLVLVFGTRFLALWLAHKVEEKPKHIDMTVTMIEEEKIYIE